MSDDFGISDLIFWAIVITVARNVLDCGESKEKDIVETIRQERIMKEVESLKEEFESEVDEFLSKEKSEKKEKEGYFRKVD